MSTPNVEHRPAESAQSHPSRTASNIKPVSTASDSRGQSGRPAAPPPDARTPTDDEILGLDLVSDSSPSAGPGSQPAADAGDQPASDQATDKTSDSHEEPARLHSIRHVIYL